METFDKFYALSAPIRREIIALLSEGTPLTATSIAEKFKVSPPAISQHLKVLLGSNILTVHRQAQKRIYQLNSVALRELETWAGRIVGQLDSMSSPVENDRLQSNVRES